MIAFIFYHEIDFIWVHIRVKNHVENVRLNIGFLKKSYKRLVTLCFVYGNNLRHEDYNQNSK